MTSSEQRFFDRLGPASGFRTVVVFLLCCSSFLLPPSSFAADVPAAINYQGVLADANGSAVTSGYYHIEFRIWDHLTATGAGDLIWGREFPLHVLDGGVFHIMLTDDGGEVSHPSAQTNDLRQAFRERSRYLGLTITRTPSGLVAGPTEISPRQQLVNVPYAFHSQQATDVAQATGSFRVEGGVVVASDGLDVTHSTRLHNELTVGGETTFDGSLQVGQTLTVHGTTDVHSLHVHAAGARFDSSVAVDGDLVVEAPSTIAGYGTIPIGGIIPWNGPTNTIPDGWALCNGGTHAGHATPDLRNRFVVGAGQNYDSGDQGGENTHQLSLSELPEHDHSITIEDESRGYAGSGTGGYFWRHENNDTTTSTGDNAAHENRPPYYALCFIMRVK